MVRAGSGSHSGIGQRSRIGGGPSAARRGLRFWSLAGQVVSPVVHEPAAALEEVRAPIRRLDLVTDHVREGCLDDVARMIRLLGRPIAERRPEAVRHGRDLERCEQSTQMLFHDWLPVADGEDNRSAVAEGPGLVEDVDGAAA